MTIVPRSGGRQFKAFPDAGGEVLAVADSGGVEKNIQTADQALTTASPGLSHLRVRMEVLLTGRIPTVAAARSCPAGCTNARYCGRGLYALLIGGGCLCRCPGRRHRPPCGRPWGPEEDRGTRSPGPHPRIDLDCTAGAQRRQNPSLSGRPRAGGGLERGAALTAQPAERAAEGSGAKGGQNRARYGSAGWQGRTWRGFIW